MKSPENESKTGLAPIAKRAPIQRQIDLRFSSFEGLVTAVSANLSTSGMFLRSDTPEPPGTEFSFKIEIEEWSPVHGKARVVWIRTRTEGPERPAGMGVEFLDLDQQSRRMIRWLVDRHLQAGGRAFDLERVPAGATRAERTTRAEATGLPYEPAGTDLRRRRSRSRPHRLRALWLLGGLLLLALSAAAAYRLWLDRQPGRGRLRPPVAEVRTPVADTPRAQDQGSATGAVVDIPPGSVESVTSFVRSWAAAWESLDADALAALYAADFEAAVRGGRSAWRAGVERRMQGADYLNVAISGLQVEFPDAERAAASFYRTIRSPGGDETRRMLLELEPADGSWLIHRESYLD